MKIAVFGTGGVGGYFGGLLALAGHDVSFIARGEHLDALREHGLQVHSVNGNFSIYPVKATDDPATIGEVDYVIVAVKHYHLADTVRQIHPLVGKKTTVVPLLNGVDTHTILMDELDPESVVGGLCSISSLIESPGIIRQPSQMRNIVVGELDRMKSERVEKIVNAWKELGVNAVQSEDIYVSIWTKYLFIASFGGVSSLTRSDMGSILGTIETRQLFIDSMQEIEALARAQDINLSADIVQSTLAMVEGFEPTITASMQRDVIDGKLFELEAFSGKIVRLGRELSVSTPVHRTIYGLLLPLLKQAM